MPKLYESDLDRVFNALGDATRRDVVARLAAGRVATVGELASAYAMALPSFSEHLGALERAGLVERTREGRHHRISLRTEALADLRAWLDGLSPATAAAPRPPALDDAEVLRRAEELVRVAAPKMAIVARVLDPHHRQASLDGEFTPEAHAVRRLARAALDAPEVRGELAEAQAQFDELARRVARARAGEPTPDLPAAVFPLARRLYAWQGHPLLKDAFPRAGAAVA